MNTQDIDDLLTYIDDVIVDDYNVIKLELTMDQRDLLIDALALYKEMQVI